jgi:hypothetical protein
MRMIGLVLSGLAPLKMMMVARMGAKRRAELAASAVDAIAGEGPDSLIGDAKRDPRVRGRVLGELAAGLAELAFRPGGVDLFGEHFCADGCGRAQSPACAARGRGAAGGAR